MPNQKHLTLEDRSIIASMLKDKATFKEIANILDKDPSTISKEIRSHLVFRRVGGGAHKLQRLCKSIYLHKKTSLYTLPFRTQIQSMQALFHVQCFLHGFQTTDL